MTISLATPLRALSLVLVLLASGRAARAQTGAVRGTLLEVGSGKPISFASVVLLRATDSTEIAGAQASELGDKGTFTLRVADVFNTLRFNSTAFGPGLATDIRFKRESRIAFLGFAYRFGQNRAKTNRKDNSEDGGGFE